MDADEEEEEVLVAAPGYPVCDFPEDWSLLPLEGEEGPGQEEGQMLRDVTRTSAKVRKRLFVHVAGVGNK